MGKFGTYPTAGAADGTETHLVKQGGATKKATGSALAAPHLATAATDATTKANAAQAAAIAAAATDATTKANTAVFTAIVGVPAQGFIVGPGNNVLPSVFDKARKAKARVRAGAANMSILFVGDSKTMGTGANLFTNTLPMQVQALMNAYDIPTTVGWILPDQGTSTPADSRYTLNASGTGWTVMTQLNFSQGWFNAPSAATGVLRFTPPHTFDTVRVWYYKSSGHGTSTITIGGASPTTGGTTIVGNGTAGLNIATFTMGSQQAANTNVDFTGPTGGQLFIAGIEATLSTQRRALVTNGGRGGYTTSNIISNTNPYDAQQCYAIVQPDITIFQIGTNDATGALAASTFGTRLTTAIGYAQTYGDVILMPTAPSSGANYLTYEPQYAAQERTLAASLGCGLFDLESRFTNYATSNPLGLMFDTLHPNELGYSDMASGLFQMIRSI